MDFSTNLIQALERHITRCSHLLWVQFSNRRAACNFRNNGRHSPDTSCRHSPVYLHLFTLMLTKFTMLNK